VLDVGPAKGWFMAAAARRGARVHGIEPEEGNALAVRGAALSVEVGSFPDDLVDRGSYDAVVSNACSSISPIRPGQSRPSRRCSPEHGHAVINAPSSRGAVYRLACGLGSVGVDGPVERLWQKGLPSPHVSYFSPESLRLLVERSSGLERIATFSLASLARAGLYDRVTSTFRGLRGRILFGIAWLGSFGLPLLPADIQVAVFRRREGS
jgi:hypothetical protein